MNTLDAINTRRAVKHYDPEHRLTEEEEKQLMTAAMQAPTAFNLQHWRFLVVKDPEVRQKIRDVAWDQAQVTDASLLIIMCADTKAWEKQPVRYWKDAPSAVQEFMLPAIHDYYNGKDQVQRDECMRSCGLAGNTIMLAAKAMGYESCPMDGFDFEKVAEIINLPSDHVISFMIAVGKGTKDPWPKPGQLPYDEVVIENSF
ncbi:MAG: nitroreductase family protein [Verrucomicrobiota bacterium]